MARGKLTVIEEAKRRGFNWWWVLLVASALLFIASTSDWTTELKTMGAVALVMFNVTSVVASMLISLVIVALFPLTACLFERREVSAQDKRSIVRYAAMLETVFAGLALIKHLN